MKEIKEEYEPIEADFMLELEAFKQRSKYVRIHYFNDYHEYISVAAVIKEITTEPEGAFLVLSTGDKVRLDKIVRFDEKPVAGYNYEDFTCDC